MRIFTNTLSQVTQKNLSGSQKSLGVAIERLSSGLRINQAADDAAGLAIANRMESRIRGQDMAKRNALDAQSILNTTEGSINEVNNLLQRMRELAVQQRNGTNSPEDTNSIFQEIEQLKEEIDRIGAGSSFGGIDLASAMTKLNIQIGSEALDSIDIQLQPINVHTLGLDTNSVPMGPPLKELTIDSGPNAGTWSLRFDRLYTSEGEFLYAGGEAEAYFGVAPGSITFHQALNLDGTPKDQSYIIKVGSKNYLRYESGLIFDHAKGEISYSVDNHWRYGAVNDPDNGITIPKVFLEGRQIGWSKDGQMIEYYEWQGNYVLGKQPGGGSVQYGNDVNLSGPNKNTLELMEPDLLRQIDLAINQIDAYRTYLGATNNRLDSIVSGLDSSGLAIKAAQSRIQDADYALEISNLTRSQILQQAGQSVLAQANKVPQGVLSLLQG